MGTRAPKLVTNYIQRVWKSGLVKDDFASLLRKILKN